MPTLRTNQSNVGIEVFVQNPDLRNLESTFLTVDASAAAGSFTVQRGTGFSVSQYVIVDALREVAEILLLHSSSAPTATLLTLAATSAYAHAQDTEVRFIPYNQVVIETSADNSSWSVAATVDLQPDKADTVYLHAAGTAGTYYRARFKNANDTTYSPYTDSVLGSGYAANTVYAMKSTALAQTGEKIGETITDDLLNTQLWIARRQVHHARKRWSWRQQFNTNNGALTEGQWRIAVPTTLDDPNTAKNILGVRIGVTANLTKVGKRELDAAYEGTGHTTVATQPSVGATSLVLTDTGDLEDSGTVVVGANSITYTANSRTTNTLSGIPASSTGSIDTAHAVGVDAWQGITFGLPGRFTVHGGYLYFDVPLSSDYEGRNCWVDFYQGITAYNSDGDVLDEPQYDFYVRWLAYIIRKRKNNGVASPNDEDLNAYQSGVIAMIQRETSDQPIQFVPDIADIMAATL